MKIDEKYLLPTGYYDVFAMHQDMSDANLDFSDVNFFGMIDESIPQIVEAKRLNDIREKEDSYQSPSFTSSPSTEWEARGSKNGQ